MPNRKVTDLMTSGGPSVTAIEALRRNLLYAMFKTVTVVDVNEIVAVQVEKAKGGDGKAAKLILGMVQTASQGASPVYMQQAIIGNGNNVAVLSEVRRMVVAVVASEGPRETKEIAVKLGTTERRVLEAIDSSPTWFSRENDGLHITDEARASVLEQ